MIRKQPKPLQILHKHTQLIAFIYDSYHVLTFKRHATVKAVLLEIVSKADKSKDWTCYRSQKAIAKAIYGTISDSGLRTVRRCVSKLKEWGYLEVVGREFKTGQGDGGACLGLNIYRVTDKLLRAVGLQRESRRKPLIKLKDLWSNAMQVFLARLQRYGIPARTFRVALLVWCHCHKSFAATGCATTWSIQVEGVNYPYLCFTFFPESTLREFC